MGFNIRHFKKFSKIQMLWKLVVQNKAVLRSLFLYLPKLLGNSQ